MVGLAPIAPNLVGTASATPGLPLSIPPGFRWEICALHCLDAIRLKNFPLPDHAMPLESSAHELQFQLGPDRYLFVYRFGCLVFVNTPETVREEVLARLTRAGVSIARPMTTESYEVLPGPLMSVEFQHARVALPTLSSLRMVARTVAQSATLERYESRAEELLHTSSKFIQKLSKDGVPPLSTRKLLRMIGSIAATRQDLVSQLAVFDAPDETWESAELESFFEALQDNFEIEMRSRILDKKLNLIQEHVGWLVELTSTKRSHLLELLIVGLILLEIVLWKI